jgi:hypothetical protein
MSFRFRHVINHLVQRHEAASDSQAPVMLYILSRV